VGVLCCGCLDVAASGYICLLLTPFLVYLLLLLVVLLLMV
jgi:hypothetical protein